MAPSRLGARDIAATVVSAMVGSGIFLTPGLLLREGAPAWVVLALFAASGLVAFLGALTVAELAAAHPGNGGPFLYLSARLGPAWGFLYNWSRFWAMQCGALAILSLTCVRFLAASMGFEDPRYEALAAVVLLASTAVLNARGLRLGARVQLALTSFKILTLLALSAGILAAADTAGFTQDRPHDLPGGMGSWTLLAIFAFGGWSQVTFLAGEVHRAALPRAMGAAILGTTTVYLLAVAAMFLATDASTQGILALEAARSIYGEVGHRLVAVTIAVFVAGTLHTMTLTGPRLYAAAAQAGSWWRPFARTNRHGAPGRALMFQAEWAAILVAASFFANNAFVALIGGIGTAIWFFHAAVAWAWFKGARPPQGFRTPAAPWTPALFLAAAVGVVALGAGEDVTALRSGAWDHLNALWAFLLMAAGLPAAWAVARRRAGGSANPGPPPR